MYGFGKVTVEYCTFRNVRFALYLKRNSSTETLRNNFLSSCGHFIYDGVTGGNKGDAPVSTVVRNNGLENVGRIMGETAGGYFSSNMRMSRVEFISNTVCHVGTMPFFGIKFDGNFEGTGCSGRVIPGTEPQSR